MDIYNEVAFVEKGQMDNCYLVVYNIYTCIRVYSKCQSNVTIQYSKYSKFSNYSVVSFSHFSSSTVVLTVHVISVLVNSTPQ